LASGEWEWQDRFTLAEQLKRIADNLISKRVEQWKRRPQEQMIVYMDLVTLDEALAGTDDDEEGYDPEKLRLDRRFHIADMDEDEMEELYERAFRAVAHDEELTAFVEAIRVCNDLDEICEWLAISKKEAYNRNKRLQR
jgi:hypothetical protein